MGDSFDAVSMIVIMGTWSVHMGLALRRVMHLIKRSYRKSVMKTLSGLVQFLDDVDWSVGKFFGSVWASP